MPCGSRQLYKSTNVKAVQRACVDCFKVSCIGRVIVTEQRGVTLVFANIYNLLNLFRSIGSGYNVILQGDVTHKASSAALHKLVYGTNRWYTAQIAWVATSLRWCTRSFQPKASASIRTLLSGRLSMRLPGSSRDCLHAIARIIRHARRLHKPWRTRK